MVVMGLLFVEGMRSVMREGLNRQRAFIVGISLAIAVGLQNRPGLLESVGGSWSGVLGNGVLVGVGAAVLLTLVLELTGSRRSRLETALDYSSLPDLDAFLRGLGGRMGWSEASLERLCAAGEETLSAMMQLREDHEADTPPRVMVNARPGTGVIELEFMALFSEENLEDRIAYISEQAEAPDVGDISFRLLRLYASAVRHRKYYGIDIVTVEVEGGG